jgi:hypothetical protein
MRCQLSGRDSPFVVAAAARDRTVRPNRALRAIVHGTACGAYFGRARGSAVCGCAQQFSSNVRGEVGQVGARHGEGNRASLRAVVRLRAQRA